MRLLTVALILLGAAIAVGAALAAGGLHWRAETAELHARLNAARVTDPCPPFDSRDLEGLPPPVQRYFRTALRDGQRAIAQARFSHVGTFNMGETSPDWRPFSSSQIVTTRPPGFDWDGRVQLVPGFPAFVHDAYIAGEGLLLARIAGLVTVAEERGTAAVAEGELLRYLAEAVWYPTALLPSHGVRWTEIDASSARAALTDGTTTVSLLFRFGADGFVQSMATDQRPRIVAGTVERQPWGVRVWAYEVRHGLSVPLEGEVSWVLPEGPYPYWRGRVSAIEFE